MFAARHTTWRRADQFEAVITRMDILNGAYDGMFDLINVIRQTSRAKEATTWDEWWDAARPAWKHWWKLAGNGLRPPNREEWLNYEREREGFKLQRKPSGKTELRVRGPGGTRCEVYEDSVRVASGQLPIHFVHKADPGSVRVPEGILIRAMFSDGRAWEKTFVFNRDQTWTLTLLGSERHGP